jgi:hypothetical protein
MNLLLHFKMNILYYIWCLNISSCLWYWYPVLELSVSAAEH